MTGSKYLLDTHCLLWFQEDNGKIPEKTMSVIQDTSNQIYFSQISLFEIAIKKKIGKLPKLKVEIDVIFNQAIQDGFSFLGIQNEHIDAYQSIKLFENHRDPFDRLLLATAFKESISVITADVNFNLYSKTVTIIW